MLTVEDWIKKQYGEMQQEEIKIVKRKDANCENGQIYEISKCNTTTQDWGKFLFSLKKDTNKDIYRFDFDSNKIYLYLKEE